MELSPALGVPDSSSSQDSPVIAVCTDQNLIKFIFQRLDIADLCAAASVCHLWNEVSCEVLILWCGAQPAYASECLSLHAYSPQRIPSAAAFCLLASESYVNALLLQVSNSEDFWSEVSFQNKVVYPNQVGCLRSRDSLHLCRWCS